MGIFFFLAPNNQLSLLSRNIGIEVKIPNLFTSSKDKNKKTHIIAWHQYIHHFSLESNKMIKCLILFSKNVFCNDVKLCKHHIFKRVKTFLINGCKYYIIRYLNGSSIHCILGIPSLISDPSPLHHQSCLHISYTSRDLESIFLGAYSYNMTGSKMFFEQIFLEIL